MPRVTARREHDRAATPPAETASRKIRVLHLLSSTGFHGAENMAATLIRRLPAEQVENHVGLLRSHDGSNLDLLEAVRDVVKWRTVFECNGRLDWRVARALRRYVRVHDIDVIHSHKYKTNFYAAIACFGLNAALVSTCHNWLGTSGKMRFYAALDKRILASFDKAVGVSEEVAKELRKHVRDANVAKIDNGIDAERFDAPLPKRQAQKAIGVGTRPVIGFVGRLVQDKAVSDLLRASRLLKDRGLPVDLLIVGDGDYAAALRAQAHALDLDTCVHFLGRRQDTPRLYAAMDVFVLPSMKEAFPMVLLEAMAAGVPVVATKVGDAAYVLDAGACGTLINPGNAEELAGALTDLLRDPERARQLSTAGRDRVRERFSSSVMARRYRDLYIDALHARGRLQ